jgi:hypothetical protein
VFKKRRQQSELDDEEEEGMEPLLDSIPQTVQE